MFKLLKLVVAAFVLLFVVGVIGVIASGGKAGRDAAPSSPTAPPAAAVAPAPVNADEPVGELVVGQLIARTIKPLVADADADVSYDRYEWYSSGDEHTRYIRGHGTVTAKNAAGVRRKEPYVIVMLYDRNANQFKTTSLTVGSRAIIKPE